MSNNQYSSDFLYEENYRAGILVSEILESRIFILSKLKKLIVLKKSFRSPLAISRAEYYINDIKRRIAGVFLTLTVNILLLLHLAFVLLRVYWYCFPEKNTFKKLYGENFNPSDWENMFIYFFIFLILYVAVHRLIMFVKNIISKSSD